MAGFDNWGNLRRYGGVVGAWLGMNAGATIKTTNMASRATANPAITSSIPTSAADVWRFILLNVCAVVSGFHWKV